MEQTIYTIIAMTQEDRMIVLGSFINEGEANQIRNSLAATKESLYGENIYKQVEVQSNQLD